MQVNGTSIYFLPNELDAYCIGLNACNSIELSLSYLQKTLVSYFYLKDKKNNMLKIYAFNSVEEEPQFIYELEVTNVYILEDNNKIFMTGERRYAKNRF